jgi:glycosyltransferase involved in cell wall biosynthesis
MPRISVIIATYNRCGSLKKTIYSLLEQEEINHAEYEIIVVDNNSKDRTKEVAEEAYREKAEMNIVYVFEPTQGKSNALNTGIKVVKGDIVAFIDDDAIADKKWLVNIVRCFRDRGCDAMGGRILPLYPNDTPEWVRKHRELLAGPIVSHDYGEETMEYDKKTMYPFVGANMAVKKSCFEGNGYFRTDLGPAAGTCGEETELFARLWEANKKIVYCGAASVQHETEKARMTYSYFAKWWIKRGRYRARMEQNRVKTLALVFGFPRYLLPDILESVWGCLINIADRQNFLKNWFELFLKIGVGLESWRLYQIAQKPTVMIKNEV